MQCGRVGSRLLLDEGRSKDRYPERPSFFVFHNLRTDAENLIMAIILSLYYRVCHIIFPPYYISRVLTVSSYLVYCFLFRSQSVVLHAQLFLCLVS